MNIGGLNESAMNATAKWVRYPSYGSNWIAMVHDIRFNSSSAINQTLNDTYQREGRFETAFPGISVPQKLWPNVKNALLANMSLPENTILNCDENTRFLDIDYAFCAYNASCNMQNLANISIQFSGNETFIYPPTSYVSNNLSNSTYCAIGIYGHSNPEVDYYQLGSKFLENYYLEFNYTNQSVGLNGFYYLAESVDKPVEPGYNIMLLWAVILISCGVVGIVLSVCVCLYIKQKNRTLGKQLGNYKELDN